ncbi:cadherin-like beta sandwich domain-containing protein [Anaeromicropila populeti]|uniref:Cadherin-like beta sandwich domain-containing protein n=1 Tax=Anaeromicropila populeti TaxID=37658 RepID=A0A1I6LAK0_9FIRM|nr:cadherin-like beta sandwich domain-containing protein [Anaeromicropila populeti]SFS00505.1 Cadherin-like beta sandwich domain-containing protein [Anaeromicropila populeti]
MSVTIYKSSVAKKCLSGLSVNDINSELCLNPGFLPTVLEYKISTEYDLPETPDEYSITITPTMESVGKIKVNGTEVENGQPSFQINLDVGLNTIPIQIISNTGNIMREYKILITRASNANLKELVIGNDLLTTELTPAFLSNMFFYSADFRAYNISSINVKAKAEDPKAFIRINGINIQGDSNSVNIELVPGSNLIYVTVGSHVGSLQQTYQIVLQK